MAKAKRGVVLAALLIGGLVAGGAAYWFAYDGESDGRTAALAPSDASRAEAPAGEADPELSPSEEDEKASVAGDGADDAREAAEAAGDADIALDVIRIDKDGQGVVAGRAEAGSEVEIVVDGEVVGEAQADADGAFVALIDTEESADAQQITARAQVVDSDEPAVASQPALVIAAAEPEAAPIIVQPEADGVRVVQPATQRPEGGVALDSISYDGEGRVVFSGRAEPGSTVLIYLNDALTAKASVADDASWRTKADETIAEGDYRLRIDQVDADGSVRSRLASPFLREAVEDVVAIGPDRFTVQAGDNLWRIAEAYYGEGGRYTLIYGANTSSIRDPDLIYPGQVFAIPEGEAPSE